MKLASTFSFLIIAFSSSLFASEPSAYGAGDLEAAQPYGLTEEEKVLLQTKKHLQKVEVKTNTQENKVNSLRERIDGLQTIVEGLVKNNHKNRLELSALKEQLQQDEISSDQYQKRVEELLTQNTQQLQELSIKLENVKEDMQTQYVSKNEFHAFIDSFNQFKKLVASELKQENPLDKKSKAQILKDARKYYNKKYYTKAIEYYKYLLAHNYKPARSSYMLGEIYYYKRDYATAIAYFKESAKRYSKASYMPILLLHTAVAMQKTGDKKNARKFFQALVKKYPSSKEAKTAKKYLK
ncbi:MAG: tetratricopeptide repeat protein [Epsilonproteobacteria bacterium]|nr:tetratricopeptide repeat protein [Campylobacterota bacterium]